MTRLDFLVLVNRITELEQVKFGHDHPLHKKLDDALMAEAKKVAPKKRPKTVAAAVKIIGEEAAAKIRAPIQVEADALITAHSDALKAARDRADEAAQELQPEKGDLWLNLATVYLYEYSTQPNKRGYANARAKLHAAGAEALGIETRVVPKEHGEGTPQRDEGTLAGFDVEVHVRDSLDVEILQRRPLPVREFVRLSWKFGANVRVFLPFLPHGYEEKDGLDFFGNDLRSKVAR